MKQNLMKHANCQQTRTPVQIWARTTGIARQTQLRVDTEYIYLFQNETTNSSTAVFCEFENKLGDTVNLFVKNITDPVGEFWEKKALEQTAGVCKSIAKLFHSIC